jgi:hypothetical protein
MKIAGVAEVIGALGIVLPAATRGGAPHPTLASLDAIEHFRRVLRPGGALQLLFHVGDEPWSKTEGYGAIP